MQPIAAPGPYSFDGTCVQLHFAPGTTGALNAVTATLSLTYPTGTPSGLPRRYDIAGNVVSGFTATLRVCYSHDDLARAGISSEDEHRLVLYRYEAGNGWVPYTSVVHTETNVITTTVTGFSTWAIGIPETHEPTAVGLRAAKQEQSRPAPWLGLLMGVGMLCLAGVYWLQRRRQ
ncbi:MAG: hypothetical protein JW850_05570 [Thermoflexales bacterium]|nr:hypothetical protein [Thermoflexales bacterium]